MTDAPSPKPTAAPSSKPDLAPARREHVRLPGGGAIIRRRRASSFTPKRQAAFLQHLGDTGNVTASAAHVRVNPSAPYALRRQDPDFAARWRAALAHAYERIEGELLKRALNGYDRPVVHAGRQTDTIHTMDTGLMLKLLAQHRATVGTAAPTEAERAAAADAARDRLDKRLAELCERLDAPLPPGLSIHERAAPDVPERATDGATDEEGA